MNARPIKTAMTTTHAPLIDVKDQDVRMAQDAQGQQENASIPLILNVNAKPIKTAMTKIHAPLIDARDQSVSLGLNAQMQSLNASISQMKLVIHVVTDLLIVMVNV
jgi:hypothetical protein